MASLRSKGRDASRARVDYGDSPFPVEGEAEVEIKAH